MEHLKLLPFHLLQWMTILSIVSYFIINNIIFNKCYLTTSNAIISTTIPKAKVIGLDDNGVIYDTTDIIYPPAETDTLFITTSIINTANQRRGICTPNLDEGIGLQCTTHAECPQHQYDYIESGAMYTGTCNTSVNMCCVYAWCPIQSYESQQTITNISTGTIFLDMNVLFPYFDVIVTNTYNKNNNYAPMEGYNLFVIDWIIGNATNGTLNTKDISQHGIVILMTAEWNCNLDLALNECIPHYSYYRIDAHNDTISMGFNFRNAWYHSNGRQRMLQKRSGIRIIFASYGTATKTNIIVLVFNICIGVMLLIISLIVAYYVMHIVCRKYNSKKCMTHDLQPANTDEIMFNSPSVSTDMRYEGNSNETLMGHCPSTNMW